MLSINNIYIPFDPRNYKNKITEYTTLIGNNIISVKIPPYINVTRIRGTLDYLFEISKTYTVYHLIKDYDNFDLSKEVTYENAFVVKVINYLNNTTMKCSLNNDEFLVNTNRILSNFYSDKDSDYVVKLSHGKNFFKNLFLKDCLESKHKLYLCISNDKFNLLYMHVISFIDKYITCNFMNQTFIFDISDDKNTIYVDYLCEKCMYNACTYNNENMDECFKQDMEEWNALEFTDIWKNISTEN